MATGAKGYSDIGGGGSRTLPVRMQRRQRAQLEIICRRPEPESFLASHLAQHCVHDVEVQRRHCGRVAHPEAHGVLGLAFGVVPVGVVWVPPVVVTFEPVDQTPVKVVQVPLDLLPATLCSIVSVVCDDVAEVWSKTRAGLKMLV